MSSLVDRWSSMSRPLQWSLWATAVLVLYFVAVDPALAAYGRWSSRADSKQAELTRFASERALRKSADDATASGIARYGEVAPPAAAVNRSEALNSQITKILREEGIRTPTIASREQAMSGGPLSAKLAPDERLQRLVTDIRFEAPANQCARVLAALEQTPEVATVSRVQLSATGTDRNSGVVRAWFTVEAWQITKKGKSR